jgi:ParB family chromosome partitioning protein
MGAVVVHRGLLRAEQVKALRAQAQPIPDANSGGEGEPAEAPTSRGGLSEKLVRRLSAHRTAALQAEVARRPRIALVALVHQLAQRVILGGYGASPVNISATPQDRLEQHAPDVTDAPAAQGLRAVREAWAARLPEDPKALFSELLAMEHEELLSLLAVCVGLTISAIAQREDEAPAALLAQAVGLDMHSWWMPTAASYFDHVLKARALEAVQVFAPGEVQRLAKLKKTQIASEAERLAAGSGWLPQMLTEPVQTSEALNEHEPEDHLAA